MEWMFAAGLLVWWCYRRETKRERRSAAMRHPARRTRAGQAHRAGQAPTAPVVEGVLMAVADDHAYWFASGRLMRAPYRDGSADVGRAEPADPLLIDDLAPGLVLEIIDALEQAQAELDAGRPAQ